MPKLPIISSKEACRRFERIGYQCVRQCCSHIRLTHSLRKPLTIPDHTELGKGLLRKLLRDSEITVEEFLEL